MANMFTELTIPELPRWATDVGATLEPSEAKKDEGNVVAKRPPARWDNWIKYQNYLYCQQVLRTTLGNWKALDYASKPSTCRSVIYHPDHGTWLIATADGTNNTLTSSDGYQFANDAVITTPESRSIAIDSTHILIGLQAGVITRRDSAGAYTSVTSGTIGGTGTIQTIITKHPSDDLILCSRAGTIRRAASSGGSWSAATTQPPSPITTGHHKLVWAGGSTFFLMQGNAGATRTYTSTDDGDNWAVTTTFPWSGLTVGDAWNMAYNPRDDMLVVVGDNDSGVARIEYSEDSGVTWTVATIDFAGVNIPLLEDVYYCGQGFWVAVGTPASEDSGILISSDGKTWTKAGHDRNTTFSSSVEALAGSQKHMIMVGTDGVSTSLNVGTYNP
jgi:hypothetical protein